MSGKSEWVEIEREVGASIETVWKMWTDPNLFKQWYGPMGMQIPFAEMDAVVGGSRKICMKMKRQDQTMTMWFFRNVQGSECANAISLYRKYV